MSSKAYSAAVVGVDAFEVEVEVHAGWGEEGKVAVALILRLRGVFLTALGADETQSESSFCEPPAKRFAVPRRVTRQFQPYVFARNSLYRVPASR